MFNLHPSKITKNKASGNESLSIKLVLALFLTSLVLLPACAKQIKKKPVDSVNIHEVTKKTAHYPHTLSATTFSGRVISTSDKAVVKATVDVNGKTTKTDKYGFFRLTVLAKEKKQDNRFVMNIRKKGFGLVSKVYSSGIKDGVWKMTKATVTIIDPSINNVIRDARLSNICNGSLSSKVDWSRYEHRRTPRRVNSQGQYVGEASAAIKSAVEFAENATDCNGGISIALPANSLVDSQGNAPAGKVTVSLSTIDIYDPDSMPGDYTVRLQDLSG